jgi:hypothetical protein
MALTIQDDSMTSGNTRHTARLAPSHERAWQTSWLSGRLIDRNTAITAMVLTNVVGTDDVHAGHRLWPHIEGWAAELGLTAYDALAWASDPTGRVSTEKGAVALDDREADDS